jgi:hypothetical protein
VTVEVVFTLNKRYKGGLVVFVNLNIWPRYPTCLTRPACDNFKNRDDTRLGGTDIRLELKLDVNYNSVNNSKAVFYISNSFGKLFYSVCDFVVGFPLEIWSNAREKSVTPFNKLHEKIKLRPVAGRLKRRHI